jgi:hypothetical protein
MEAVTNPRRALKRLFQERSALSERREGEGDGGKGKYRQKGVERGKKLGIWNKRTWEKNKGDGLAKLIPRGMKRRG